MKNTKRNVNFVAITSVLYIIFVIFFNFKFFTSLDGHEYFLKVFIFIFIFSGSVVFLSSILHLIFIRRLYYPIVENILLNSLMVFVFSLYTINLINHFLFFFFCIFLGFAFFIILKDYKTIYSPIILFFIVYIFLNFSELKIVSLISFFFMTAAFIKIIHIFNREYKENLSLNSLREDQVLEFEKISAGVFHELMNPLNTIALSIESIKDENNKEFTDIAKRSTERAIDIAHKMSNLIINIKEKINLSIYKKDVFVYKAFKNILEIFEFKIKNNYINLKINIEKDIKFFCNEFLFEQVLTTLISNSIDAVKDSNKKEIFISCEIISSIVLIKIEDSGSGIKDAFKDKVFLPFQTLKKSGNGIGLYSAKNIVQNYLSGDIHFISKEGVGSIFMLLIPLTK